MNKVIYDYYVTERRHREMRHDCGIDFAKEFSARGLSPVERMTERFERLSAMEKPFIHPEEKIVMLRTVRDIPDCFSEDEWKKIKSKHFIHELGYISNLSPNYAKVIEKGLLFFRESADEYGKRVIDAIIELCDRYRAEALRVGRDDVVKVLERVPRYSARNFREALQFFRILHYALWLEGNYHNTVGRFDQYMYPYFKKDMDAGVYSREQVFELVCDFFLSFNKDSDMYVGVQQGDNGQSMVLGGTDANGNDCFNELSALCLEASRELKLIDPKINLRVSQNTPIEIFEKGTELTKVGLGFPQYSNDDVVIDALVGQGYDRADAVNYVVAACWEFIIPAVGNDVANIGALNLPKVVDEAFRKCSCDSFDGLLEEVKAGIKTECDRIREGVRDLWFVPSPFMEILRDEKKYNNFGIHGCGIASATDALAAIKKQVYDSKNISREELIAALDSNFENSPELLHALRFESPKLGDGTSEETRELSVFLLNSFADALDGKTNCLGGRWRAGTGTAMYYLWHADEIGATADGRMKGEPFGTNFSPNLFAKIAGPVSVVEDFSVQPFDRAMNGGPLTLEFAAGVFKNSDSTKKVAALIKYFVSRGGHQLQLNAVNLEDMKNAQRDPDSYRQLVVRIWGWSAYFTELDKCFQDHVMARREYSV